MSFHLFGGGGSPVGYEISKRYVERGHHVDVVTMGFRDLPSYENVSVADLNKKTTTSFEMVGVE